LNTTKDVVDLDYAVDLVDLVVVVNAVDEITCQTVNR